MNKMFIIIGIPLVLLLSSCSTYKAVLYPCDFNKYKCFRSEFRERKTVRYNNNSKEYQADARSLRYTGDVVTGVYNGVRSRGLTFNPINRDDTLILTVGTTDGFIFPPLLGRHWTLTWDCPPKTATIIATDSVTREKLFDVDYSRYMISMDGGEFMDHIASAVEYCIEEQKKSPPKDVPQEINISTSILSEITERRFKKNSILPEKQKSDTEEWKIWVWWEINNISRTKLVLATSLRSVLDHDVLHVPIS